ncbi:MAG: right-handed parallel beta-helix repeat-containing protein [Lachnospiraceae bacterium]|nr:right-handed parallel beta-helix repeat-containing protein [Lachnospiraceae bacterium]
MQENRLADGREFDFWEKKVDYVRELYVAANDPKASDANDGSKEAPLLTIQAAAELATPGTHVWIGPGVYRECVSPAMGGDGPESMICYEAIEKGTVIIKASEEVHTFEKSVGWRLWGFGGPQENAAKEPEIWCHRLDPDMFRGYNPFCAVNILHDRLFIEFDKTDMTPYLNRRGMVFCDGKPLRQVALYHQLSTADGTYWVEANGMTVHFRLPGDADPAEHQIELTVREQCFAPKVPFLSYIKVKGLVCAHASMGAPVPQRGSISAFRGHHWVIEDCTIDWANAVGIDVGDECWHHGFDANKTIGHSVIRRCHIKDAGVCGIAGLFAAKMLIEDNLIEGTGWQKMELSWEAGGIKLHNSVDGMIRRNIFRTTYRADHLWLDCGNINNRITQNLFLDGIEQREAIFIECTREGVNLLDNNLFWNVEGRFDASKIPNEPGSSGWYKLVENDLINGYAIYGEGTDRMQIVNNFIGKCRAYAYYAKPMPFRLSPGDRGGTSRDAKLLNNLIYDCGVGAICFPTKDNVSEGNAFIRQAKGGDLRIMYPAPEVCLDLKSWREFYGFDQTGAEAWFDFEVDTKELTLTVKKCNVTPPGFGPVDPDRYVHTPQDLPRVAKDERVSLDLLGSVREGEGALPGPFAKLEMGVVYSIDPRVAESSVD